MTNANEIIHDVLLLVFRFLDEGYLPAKAFNRDLQSCALVCKHWLGPARAALYWTLFVQYEHQAVQLIKLLERHGQLRRLVKALYLWSWPPKHKNSFPNPDTYSGPKLVTLESARCLLSILSGDLKDFTIYAHWISELDLGILRTSTIKRLALTRARRAGQPETRAHGQSHIDLMQALPPSLVHLRVQGFSWETESSTPLHVDVPDLRTVALFECKGSLMALANSMKLVRLSARSVAPIDTLIRFCETTGPRLHSLSFSCNYQVANLGTSVFGYVSILRILRLGFPSAPDNPENLLRLDARDIHALPQSLVKFSWYGLPSRDASSVQELLICLADPTFLQSLQHIPILEFSFEGTRENDSRIGQEHSPAGVMFRGLVTKARRRFQKAGIPHDPEETLRPLWSLWSE